MKVVYTFFKCFIEYISDFDWILLDFTVLHKNTCPSYNYYLFLLN